MGEYSADNLKLFVGGKLMEGYSNIGVISLERGKSNGPIAVTKVTLDSWECGHFHSGCDGLNASEKYGSGCK